MGPEVREITQESGNVGDSKGVSQGLAGSSNVTTGEFVTRVTSAVTREWAEEVRQAVALMHEGRLDEALAKLGALTDELEGDDGAR